MNRSKNFSSAFVLANWMICTLMGVLLWDGIKLPFSNPEGFSGYLIQIHYSPYNDFVRFLFFILFPIAGLLIGRRWTNLRLNWHLKDSAQSDVWLSSSFVYYATASVLWITSIVLYCNYFSQAISA